MSDSKSSAIPIPIRLAWEKNETSPAAALGSEDWSLSDTFDAISKDVSAAHFKRFGDFSSGEDSVALLSRIDEFIKLMAALDAEYGPDAVLPIEDADLAINEAQRATSELDAWLSRLGLGTLQTRLHALQIGIGFWALRHSLTLQSPGPLINALAEKSNQAGSRQETAAVFALMQGVVTHLAKSLSGDLERSNPERPWRILLLNFAITSIRTGDAAMMRYAFDTLNNFLPDERKGFYEAAYHLASVPGFPVENRALIEAEVRRWTRPH